MRASHRSLRAATAGTRAHTVVGIKVEPARLTAALMLLSVVGWSTILVARGQLSGSRIALGEFGWTVAPLVATALVARGVFLGRPMKMGHALAATAMVGAALGAHLLALSLVGDILLGASGLVLMLPTTAQPQPEMLEQVWALIESTHGDPLAPFAMHSSKSYYFNDHRSAAIAYRVRLGFAVVSGDPIGDAAQFHSLAADFARMCRSRGWRIIVLACGERHLGLWRDEAISRPMLAVAMGRDVIVDAGHFTLAGRHYRNLRQAVQRTYNCGLTTAVVAEQDIDEDLAAELTDVLYAAQRSARTERGFCMSLDGTLHGRYPGIKLAIARDRGGRVVGFHRYATAGSGSEISLDVPFRRPDAPNGVDERLTVDMICGAKSVEGAKVSLAFAAFPEIFDVGHRDFRQHVAYKLIHMLDPLIRLESLYRYLRKFHALADRRYVLLCTRHLPAALVVLLSLEFVPRPRHPLATDHGAMRA